MADDTEFLEVAQLTVVTYTRLSHNIGQLQQLTGGGMAFKRALSSFTVAPEWSTEEAQKFRDMKKLIKDACDRFDDLVPAAREYVLRTKDFANDNIDFIEDAKQDLEPEDVEELHGAWKESIDEMKDCHEKVVSVKDDFNEVMKKLRRAKTEAKDGVERGLENADKSLTRTAVCAGGAVGTSVAAGVTAATGGLAAPVFALTAAWSFTLGAIKCSADVLRGFMFGPVTTSDDSSIQDKHKRWVEAFAQVAIQLDNACEFIGSLTDDSTKILRDLSVYTKRLLVKCQSVVKLRKLLNNKDFEEKFDELGNQSKKVKTACLEYIKQDNAARGITGTMAKLSLQD